MRIPFLLISLMMTGTAHADSGDELRPVPAVVLIGKSYAGVGVASEILFINARRAPVRLNWIGFDGVAKFYALVPPGGEITQPTFVSHRWLIMREYGDSPIEAFIATRADVHSDGQAQLAIIR